MALEIRDPTTGKIKPVYLVAGVGIGGAALFLLLGRGGGSSGVTSGGQSGDNTDALASLQDAINGLASGGGGGGSGSSNSGTTGGPTASGGTGFGDTVGAVLPEEQVTIPSYGDSNVPASVGSEFAAKVSVPSGETMTPVNTYPAAANTPQALSKPSNSGLSSAPTVFTPTVYTSEPTASVAKIPGAVLPVASGSGPKSIAYKPGGPSPIVTTGTPQSNQGPKSIAYKAGTLGKKVITAVKPTSGGGPKSVASKPGITKKPVKKPITKAGSGGKYAS
jgi:hypothetical protein